MTRILALATSVIFLAPRPEAHRVPPPPLPSLPSVARVHLDVSRDHVVIVEDVDLPRGDWRSGDLELFVAYGAPGAPEAFDAHVLPVPDGAIDPDDRDAGTTIPIDRVPFRPPTASTFVGPPQMSGAVLHIDAATFRRALLPGGMVAIRLRSLLPLPIEDAEGGHQVLVRLGAPGGNPLTLGRIQVTSTGESRVSRVDARLCGPDADPWPLGVATTPRPPAQAAGALPPIAPVLAVRHATDDLCVRFWTG